MKELGQMILAAESLAVLALFAGWLWDTSSIRKTIYAICIGLILVGNFVYLWGLV